MRADVRMAKIGVIWFGVACIAGCATIIEGRDQRVAINTSPSGADCAVERSGELIAKAAPTPESVVIRKSFKPIRITCEKPGFHMRSEIVEPDSAGWSIGNIVFGLIGAPIGLLIDSSSGALNKYDANITMALWPVQQPDDASQPRQDQLRAAPSPAFPPPTNDSVH